MAEDTPDKVEPTKDEPSKAAPAGAGEKDRDEDMPLIDDRNKPLPRADENK